MRILFVLLALAGGILLIGGTRPRPVKRPPLPDGMIIFLLENHDNDPYAISSVAKMICAVDKWGEGYTADQAAAFCGDSWCDEDAACSDDGGWRLYAFEAYDQIQAMCAGNQDLYSLCHVDKPPPQYTP